MEMNGQEWASAIATLGDVFVTGAYAWAVGTGRTKPHPLSWLIWGLLLVFSSMGHYMSGVGAAAAIPFVSGALCLLAAGMTFFWYGMEDVLRGDKLFFVAALLAGVGGVFADEKIITTGFLAAVVFFGYLPTFRKAWGKPQEENLPVFLFYTILSSASVYASLPLTAETGLYPCLLLVLNGALTTLLFVRRKSLQAAA